MAQIHALLFMSSKPLTMDEICERLAISRGNASMSLRNLMDWGVIKRYRHKGERHDLYHSDVDAVGMVAQVIRERKRREFDPTVTVLESCLSMLPNDDSAAQMKQKLTGLLEVFETVDIAFRYAMSNDERFAYIIRHRNEIRELLEAVEKSAAMQPEGAQSA